MLKKGFTLMELLVVIAIIGILSLVILVNYRTGQKQYLLQQAANQLAQDIRLAINRAITTKEFQEGYLVHGLKFSGQDSYQFISCQCCGSDVINTCRDGETINLPAKIIIASLSAQSPLTIKFIPPDPKVIFQGANGEEITDSEVKITLQHQETQATITVSVNKAGLIQIKKIR